MLRDALAAFGPQEIGFIANPCPAYDLRKPTCIVRGLKPLQVRA